MSLLSPATTPAVPCYLRSVANAEGELHRLRAQVAAKAAELQEARQAEAEYAAECEQLSRELAAERLRAMVGGAGR